MKTFATISIYCLLLSVLHISWKVPASGELPAPASAASVSEENERISTLYDMMGLREKGLSKTAFQYAYRGYTYLLRKRIISRSEYLTICDFSQSSGKKRLYVLDMSGNEVVMNTYVAHGRNSGAEFARNFSNRPRSNQSSLGFYRTQHTYSGEHGLSLRVKGLEAGFNDKAGPRAIVIHGADYVGEEWLNQNKIMGRSYGCPAVPRAESRELINLIRDGSCLFIYYPSKTYLKNSKILNG